MHKTLIQTLCAVFCAILAPLVEGGGVMRPLGFHIGMRKAAGGGWQNPYITDGLVAMWDGEWNAGGGVHDANATTWKDLVGGRIFANRTNAATPMEFGDNYCVSAAANYSYLECADTQGLESLFDGRDVTVEAVVRADCANSRCLINKVGFGVNMFRGGVLYLTDKTWNPNINIVSSTTDCYQYVGMKDGTCFGGIGTKGNSHYSGGTQTDPYNDGVMRLGIGNYVWQASRWSTYRLSVYSRALSEEERAYNYAIDQARFGIA